MISGWSSRRLRCLRVSLRARTWGHFEALDDAAECRHRRAVLFDLSRTRVHHHKRYRPHREAARGGVASGGSRGGRLGASGEVGAMLTGGVVSTFGLMGFYVLV